MLRIRRSPRVAVVGGGIVGCTVAWKIKRALGFDVDLYERRDDILLETTAGTSNRFHRGYQYALSDETARTLRDDHRRFEAVYGACAMASANYYGIAAESQLSCLDYLRFCARCRLPVRLKEPDGIFTDRVLLALLSAEKSLDLDVLRRLCRQKLEEHGVNVVFVAATPAMLQGYDYVVSAVYGNPNLLAEPPRQDDYHFGLCEMMVVDLPERYRGISAMIVYGRLMTVDVLHNIGHHVLYCGSRGLHGANVGPFARVPDAYRPLLYRTTPAEQLRGLSKADLALRAAATYFLGMRDARHVASTFVLRVQTPTDVENAVRRTVASEIRDGWFRISAAKISACVTVADRMVALLRQKETGRLLVAGGQTARS